MELCDIFTCAQCEGVFEKARTDQEAMEDALQKFTQEQLEDSCVICDDCYNVALEKKMERDPIHAIGEMMFVNDFIGVKPLELSPEMKALFDEKT